MKILRYAGIVALALSLVGCGSKEPKVYSPKVSADAEVVALYRDNDSSKLTPVRAVFEKAFDAGLKEAGKSEKETLDKFLRDSCLDGNKVKWVVLSVDDVDVKKTMRTAVNFSTYAVVLHIKHNSEKFLSACLEVENGKGDVTIEKVNVANLPALKIEQNAPEGAKESIFLSSYDDALIFLCSGEQTLGEQIAIYRDGKAAGSQFSGFDDAENVLYYSLSGLGAILRRIHEEDLNVLGGQIDLKNIKDFTFALKSNEAGVSLDASLATASEKEADNLAALFKTGIMGIVSMVKIQSSSDPSMKTALEFFSSISIKAEGARTTASAPVTEKMLKEFAKEMEDVLASSWKMFGAQPEGGSAVDK